MSIYGTTFYVDDENYDQDDPPGIVLLRRESNHHPDPSTFAHGSISGAVIPAWCVPGHDVENCDPETYPGLICNGYDHPAAWYRLSVNPVDDGDYLLNEDAAKALRDDLTAWLDLPKTRPAKVKPAKAKRKTKP